MTGPGIPESRDAITADWMRRALVAGGSADTPPIDDLVVSDIGAGVGLLAEILRCRLIRAGGDPEAVPETVIVKLPSTDPKSLRINRLQSLYKREYGYYRHLAPDMPVRSPRLLYGAWEDRGQRFVLVLEDLAHMRPGDHFAGATPDQARRAIRALARLHGRYWNDVGQPLLSDAFDTTTPGIRALLQVVYLAFLVPTLKHFGDCFSAEMRRVAEAYGPRVADHIAGVAASAPRTFIHGDYRLDNLFFGAGDDDVALIDWQVSGLACGLYDVAYFLGASVTTEVRREIERDALREYTDIVVETARGAQGFTFDECWRLYRSHMLGRLLISIIVCGGLDVSAERTRALAESGLRRTLAAIEDLEAADFLPPRRPFLSGAGLFSTLSSCAYRIYRAVRGTSRPVESRR